VSVRLSVFVALVFTLAGCKAAGLPIEESGGSFDFGPPGLAYDFASGEPSFDLASGGFPADLAVAPVAVACGEMTCTDGNACCISRHQGMTSYACMATCDPGEVSLSCDGPEDCPSTNACCATLVLGGGMGGMGSGMSSSASCESATNDCSTGNLDLPDRTITTKLCHMPSDCQGYQSNFGSFDSCCMRMGSPFSFCGPQQLDGQMGVTCVPFCEGCL